MSIDAVFIPCAGLGTRMGEVGKVVPKPLWTIGEASLLELKIYQFQKFGFNKFIINCHHQAERFKNFAKKFSGDLKISFEEELLGNGGSFHKIQRDFPNVQKILVTNPDSFYFLSSDDWKNFIEKENDEGNTLLGVNCLKDDPYNRISQKSGLFSHVEIYGKDELTSNETYGGMGIINLKTFKNQTGPSSFFSTVINSEFNKTLIVKPKSNYEFWDFGTLNDFKKILSLIEKNKAGNMQSLINNYYSDFDLSTSHLKETLEKKVILDKFETRNEFKID